MLYDAALTLQQADFTLDSEMSPALQKVETLVNIFNDHASHEDYFIFPIVKKFNPSLEAEFESEHHKDHELGQRLRDGIASWHAATDNDDRLKAGWTIYYTLNEFIGFNLYHTNKEEAMISPILWANYTDEELLVISAQIVARVAPDILAIQGRWMVKGMTNAEIIKWGSGMRMNAPAPVFQMLMQMIQTELPSERSRQITEALMQGVASA
jgi:hypothetical protein